MAGDFLFEMLKPKICLYKANFYTLRPFNSVKVIDDTYEFTLPNVVKRKASRLKSRQTVLCMLAFKEKQINSKHYTCCII